MYSKTGLFSKDISKNIAFSWTEPSRPGDYVDLPIHLPSELLQVLALQGISKLFKHQAHAINAIHNGRNIIIATGTASGKSLCFQIPILSSLVLEKDNTSLLLFPTKALANDQIKGLKVFTDILNSQFNQSIVSGIYDGDTPASHRTAIRNNTHILFSNPDMLHLGILPHHPAWTQFFSNLKYVLIDEAHVYTGVFGSHFVNLLRRLKRVASFYGANPQFILASATIANPEKFARTLIEDEVEVFIEDGSPRGMRTFVFYNPPLVNEELGIRKSMSDESIQISKQLISKDLQAISFARSRISVEMLFYRLIKEIPDLQKKIAPYRSGYTKAERRSIENSLKNRDLELVIATIALELGIDMGMVDAIVMNGYPGSITRFLQQAGRAGRKQKESYCILIASSLPIDQYVIKHPEFILKNLPEDIFLNADNPYILFNHILCAAFELPLKDGAVFGSLSREHLSQYLEILTQIDKISFEKGKYYWISADYPASDISLRSIGGYPTQIFCVRGTKREHLGVMDKVSVKRFLHPGAVYLHMGDPYLVTMLNTDDSYAELIPAFDIPYFTKPQVDIKSEVLAIEKHHRGNWITGYGEIRITEQVKGYKKLLWDAQLEIGNEIMEMGPDILETKGGWLQIPAEISLALGENIIWSINPIDYGPNWTLIRAEILERDAFTCQLCGCGKDRQDLHVHHKKPVRLFHAAPDAHSPANLVTLCKSCHKKAEKNLYIQSILSGLSYSLHNIAPFFVKCSQTDIGITFDANIKASETLPGLIFYDQFPGGLGLSEIIFGRIEEILMALDRHISDCPCDEGCPSCVGPGGENGFGAKKGVIRLLELTLSRNM